MRECDQNGDIKKSCHPNIIFIESFERKVTLLFSDTMEQFLLLQIPKAWNRCHLRSK